MTLISTAMPTFALREVDRVAVRADPSRAWAAARAVDLFALPMARWLVRMRTALDRSPPPAHARIDDLTRPGRGFQILAEAPGREVVVGCIARFWRPSIDFVTVGPASFGGFDRPGYGKLAWSIRVDPREAGGAWISIELRMGATDPGGWDRLARHWTFVGPFSQGIRHAAIRRLRKSLGAARPDRRRTLAGDRFLTVTRLQKTHEITIEAPPSEVWPLLSKVGADRAGAFDLGHVIPSLTHSPGGFAVLAREPGRSLVLGDPTLAPGGTRAPNAPPWKATWAFVLEPVGDDATCLVVRVRATYFPSLAMAFVGPALGLAHELMERRRLRALRARAERCTPTVL